MPVPDHLTLMLPILKSLSSTEIEMKMDKIRDDVISSLSLKESDMQEMTPGGGRTKLSTRFSWAMTFMLKAGLIERVKRATYNLTDEGKKLLTQKPTQLTIKTLRQYESFRKWGSKLDDASVDPQIPILNTPLEQLEQAYKNIEETLKEELLNRIYGVSPETFEILVLDLLTSMGYGVGKVTGGAGDGGIDCIISEDKLGLDKVYVQAKRYAKDHGIGNNYLLAFGGALDAKHASKGIFVTTSYYTQSAREYAIDSPKQIALLDGNRLAELMIDHDVGVRSEDTYTIKRIDDDYFDPE